MNIVEGHGRQLYIGLSVSKCKLLITARTKKLKLVEELLAAAPDILTIYGKPFFLVDESYTHIGVPQSPRNSPN